MYSKIGEDACASKRLAKANLARAWVRVRVPTWRMNLMDF